MTYSRRLQVGLAVLWLFDAALQCQPFMFTRRFADELHLVAGVVSTAPVAFNVLFVAVQLGLGIALLSRRTARVGLLGSIVWSLGVWTFGEGLGGLAAGHFMLLTGAPGAALLYAVIAVVAWPRGRSSDRAVRRMAVGAWVALWTAGAVFQLLPGQDTGSAVASAVHDAAGGAPSRLHGFLTSLAAHIPAGRSVAVALALVQLLVGVLALAPRPARHIAVATGAGLSALFFLAGQSLGELTTGQATDPNAAPVVLLLALVVAGATRVPSQPPLLDRRNPMLSRPLAVKTGAAVLMVALGATACGGSSSGGSQAAAGATATPTASASAAATTDTTATQAAALRAGLDELFRMHVNLTGFAVQTAAISGVGSKQTTAALKALDDNTVAIGDAIGSVYGADARSAFLTMWRNHIGFFVDYTVGLATKNNTKVKDAQAKLAGYKRDFAKFLSGATDIPAAAIATELQGHIQTLESAIQAILTKSKDAGAKLQMAAMHMDGTAAALAGGIAKSKSLAGTADAPASALRAALTGLLIQHVAQTGEVVQSAVATSLTSAQTQGAIAALDENTQDLGKAIGSLYGADAQTAFLKMWRAHIGFFVDYTKGLATGDKAAVRTAQAKLANYQRDFGTFLGTATGLPASAVSADLQGHVQTLEAAIQAILTKSPTAAAKISMAEDHMAGTAAVLAKAIAAQKHLG